MNSVYTWVSEGRICISESPQQTRFYASRIDKFLKPWPNGVASRRKFSTCVYLRLRSARPCVHLRWLAMTCAHFGRDQICTKVDASFSPFGHPTQVNASWEASINLLLASEIHDISDLKWVFIATCGYLRGNLRVRLATQRKFLRKFNLWLLSLRLLASPFDQGFTNTFRFIHILSDFHFKVLC